MTQKKFTGHQWAKEAREHQLGFCTRRHFLKESAMGFGALALGSLLGGCGSNPAKPGDNLFDAAHPLAPKAALFRGRANSVIILQMGGARLRCWKAKS